MYFLFFIKKKKAYELVAGQFQQLFMTFISFYFVGSAMSIFTIFFVGMYGYNSLTAILGVQNGIIFLH